MKRIAIALSIFPGSLFILAIGSFVVCAIAELGLAGGSANIGLGLLFIAFLINIPTFIVWGLHFATRRSVPTLADSDNRSAEQAAGDPLPARRETSAS